MKLHILINWKKKNIDEIFNSLGHLQLLNYYSAITDSSR